MRLLLIEDDAQSATYVADGLGARGHEVEIEGDGQRGLDRALAEPFDLLIVDRLLPSRDGLSIVSGLRDAHVDVPVLMLTALGSVEDRVIGLEGGADDYLAKPFALSELIARVDALARRRDPAPPIRLQLADLTLDRLSREVHRGDVWIELQPREFQLLETLLLQAPNVVTRTMLLEQVWRFRFDPGTNLVESHMSRLRAKIDRGGDRPLLHTIRGEGYAAFAA